MSGRRAGRRADRVRDDAGGVWITTGWVVGVLVYVGIVLTWHAGFTPALPFVVIPPLLLVMIGVGNLAGGRPRRSGSRFNRPDLEPVPISSVYPGGTPAPTHDDGDGADGGDAPAGGPGTAP